MSRVLFVCLHNAGRSQMSQALFERGAGGRHEARSAGTTPAEHVHPEVVAAMAEVGIDVSGRTPGKLTTELAEWADGRRDHGLRRRVPVPPREAGYIDLDLQDPKGLPLDEVRTIRDEIARRVEQLAAELG